MESRKALKAEEETGEETVKDANGNVLQNGDDVIVIKDLPVKGAPKPVKAGTKVKNIRLVDGRPRHLLPHRRVWSHGPQVRNLSAKPDPWPAPPPPPSPCGFEAPAFALPDAVSGRHQKP